MINPDPQYHLERGEFYLQNAMDFRFSEDVDTQMMMLKRSELHLKLAELIYKAGPF